MTPLALLLACLPSSICSSKEPRHRHRHNNIPAFLDVSYRSIHRTANSPKRTTALLSTTEPIEKKQVDPFSSANGDANDEEDETNSIEDKIEWLSATRTLGSLFLHQEDASRVTSTHVDEVSSGRKLKSSNKISEPVGGEDEIDSTSFSMPSQQGKSLSSYLLKLKRQDQQLCLATVIT